MKKYVILLVAVLLLIVSVGFNYSLNKKLETATVQAINLENQLEEQQKDNDALLDNVTSLVEELKEVEAGMAEVQEALSAKGEILENIDVKLKAEGKIIEKVDALMAENRQLKNEIAAMTLTIDASEADNSQNTGPEDRSWEVWVKDLKALIDHVDGRIGELEEAASLLPALSLERIMIQQEVDFLNKTQSDMKTLREKILKEKQ